LSATRSVAHLLLGTAQRNTARVMTWFEIV
jgi:hypothetical protein